MPCPPSFQPPGFFDLTTLPPGLFFIVSLAAYLLLALGWMQLARFRFGKMLSYVPPSKERPILFWLYVPGGALCMLGFCLIVLDVWWLAALTDWYRKRSQDF